MERLTDICIEKHGSHLLMSGMHLKIAQAIHHIRKVG